MCELAINEEGEPFDVPTQVRGWRVRRASERRGRPTLIHEGGKPLVLRVDASHADLLAAAGPGKYRLEPVDELRRRVDGVPQAWTGPLSQDDDGPGEDDDDDRSLGVPPARRARLEDVVCQLLTNQTRMVETTIGQLGTVIAGVGDLLRAAHQTGITSRTPPPAAAAPVPPPLRLPDEAYDEEDEEDEITADAAPPSMLPEALRLIIEKAIDKLVPMIVERFTSGELLDGLPLGALLDWRKAAPAAPGVLAAPTVVAPPTVAAAPTFVAAPAAAPPTFVAAPAAAPPTVATPTVVAPPGVPWVPSGPAAPAAPSASVFSEHFPFAHRVTAPPPPVSVSAGAAPSPSPLGAAPAEASGPPGPSSAASDPTTEHDAAAALNAHILQIWRGLSPPERGRATQLIMGLGEEQRAAWLAELARLSVPEAIARARAAISAPSATAPPNPPPFPPVSKE
jgi:hypothetical protein